MTAYYTTDTNELAPYPNMTSDDLRDFEAYCDEVEGRVEGLVWCALGLLALIIGIIA